MIEEYEMEELADFFINESRELIAVEGQFVFRRLIDQHARWRQQIHKTNVETPGGGGHRPTIEFEVLVAIVAIGKMTSKIFVSDGRNKNNSRRGLSIVLLV